MGKVRFLVNHVVDFVLKKIFEDEGFKLEKPKSGIGGDYCTTLSEDWELSIYLEQDDVAKFSIEIYDQKYPPDQRQPAPGGYTVMPWIYGDHFDLRDPDSLLNVRKLINNPEEYLGMDRDCIYGDRNSKHHYHNDDYHYECYHDLEDL